MNATSLGTSAARKFIDFNLRISQWENSLVSRLIPRKNGLEDFRKRVVPGLLKPEMRVLDVGGGRSPLISPKTVKDLRLHVVGLDISHQELLDAPEGSYNEVVVGDVSDVPIPGKFDLILSKTVLEHVRDNRRAILNLTRAMGDGGIMAHYVPNRYAPFALINQLIGNKLARKVLNYIHPHRKHIVGFQAYYNKCVPSQMKHLCEDCGMEVVELTPYFTSDYFEFFTPIHMLDLCRQVCMSILRASDLAETFIIITRMPRSNGHQLNIVS